MRCNILEIFHILSLREVFRELYPSLIFLHIKKLVLSSLLVLTFDFWAFKLFEQSYMDQTQLTQFNSVVCALK